MEGSSEIKTVFWLGTSVMLFLAFGLLFIVFFYQKHFSKMKQKEAELLLKTSLESEKKERQRIAKDLHDSVQGDLSAIRNYFSFLSKKIVDTDTQDLLNDIKKALDQTTENTRMISYKLMPPLLDSSGFSAALIEYFVGLEKATNKKFEFQSEASNLIIPKEKGYELFLVIQELTQNMLKHGFITACEIKLKESSEYIRFDIIDDGMPFDFKKSYSTSKGSGLHNIKSRLNSINAKIIQQEIEKGNHFIIYLNNKND